MTSTATRQVMYKEKACKVLLTLQTDALSHSLFGSVPVSKVNDILHQALVSILALTDVTEE